MLVFGASSTAMRRAALSTLARAAASKPVAPTSSGTPAAAQAQACAPTACGRLKSIASVAPASARCASSVITTPPAVPAPAGILPRPALDGEATAPLQREARVLGQGAHQ
jgi:hypothetical protein